MRLRNLKDKDILVENCDYLIKGGEALKGKWQKEFGNSNAIHIEIGMGKGDYIYHMALKYPNINFIGIEKYSGVIARAIKKYPNKLTNLRIINMDALNLNDVFSKEVETIYLNFSDPWPKVRHAKRRLTSPNFLKVYDAIFKDKNRIERIMGEPKTIVSWSKSDKTLMYQKITEDILSNYEGLAIFSNRSWVTDIGSYNASTKEFTLKEGKELKEESEENYIKRINNRVSNSFSISKMIVDNDYYNHILGS